VIVRPTITSFVRRTPNTSPTNADSLTWRITFSGDRFANYNGFAGLPISNQNNIEDAANDLSGDFSEEAQNTYAPDNAAPVIALGALALQSNGT